MKNSNGSYVWGWGNVLILGSTFGSIVYVWVQAAKQYGWYISRISMKTNRFPFTAIQKSLILCNKANFYGEISLD